MTNKTTVAVIPTNEKWMSTARKNKETDDTVERWMV